MALKSLFQSRKFSKYFARSLSTSVKLVGLEVDDKTGIATVTLQRPPVNSLNTEILSDISTTLTKLEKSKSRGAIITSTWPTTFSAGLDILEMYQPDKEKVTLFWKTLQDVFMKLYMSPYPTVAVINGHAPAGGCMLSTLCEYRIMQQGFAIGLNETKLGIIAPKWFMTSMKNVIGARQTELALSTGKLFSTGEAFKLGLVDEIVSSKSEGIEQAHKFLSQFEKISPAARSMSKQLCRKADFDDMVNNREQDLQAFLTVVFKEQTQKHLGMYLESLKKKQKSA